MTEKEGAAASLPRQAKPSAIGRYTPFVMPGLDPGIHAPPPAPPSERLN